MAQVCTACQKSNPDSAELCGNCGTPFPDGAHVSSDEPTGRLKPGYVIAERYKVVESIGAGGMGVVYRVHDTVLGEDVALKLMATRLLQDQTAVQRFLNEARVTRNLTHKNVVRVHDIGRCEDMLYISMEFVRGKSLRKAAADRAASGQPFSTEEVISIMCQICDSLEYAHRFTIHRDIKPENVMLTEAGDVKLMDFGLSKLLAAAPNLTMTAAVMGTPMYMAPEQFRDSAHVDLRADLFSAGIMLYELLTGRIPTGMARPASQMREGIPSAMDLIVSRCTAAEADQRYSSAGEIRADLQTALLEMRGEMPVVERKPGKRRPVLKAVLALVFVAAVVAGVWAAVTARQQPRLEAEIALAAMNKAIRQTPIGIALERRVQADSLATQARQLDEEGQFLEAVDKAAQARLLYLALLPPSADENNATSTEPDTQEPESVEPEPAGTDRDLIPSMPESVSWALQAATAARSQASDAGAADLMADLYNQGEVHWENALQYREAGEADRAQDEYVKAEEKYKLAATEAVALSATPDGMVYVPSGKFTMGSSEGAPEEQPVTTVTLPGFYIDAHEVSFGEFQQFLQAGQRAMPTAWQAAGLGPSDPAIGVTWLDATAYAQWAGKRLPTEAEWEKAARGTKGLKYPWGADWIEGLCNAAGTQFDEFQGVAPVNSFPESKSPYGCYNMAGNAIEWTSSLYGSYPYVADDGREILNEAGSRVLRGGSHLHASPGIWLRTTARVYAHPTDISMLPGFRCARDALSSSASTTSWPTTGGQR